MGAVKDHPQVDEIREHLTKYSLTVQQIIDKYSTDEYPVTKDSINWYRRKYVKPIVDEAKENIREEIVDEVNEAWRVEKYKLIDMIRMMRHEALKAFQKGRVSINTITEILKIVELEAKLSGELQDSIIVTFAWGDKLNLSPRHNVDKGKILTMEDLEKMR